MRLGLVERVTLRAGEDVAEFGGILPAMAAIQRDIKSGDYPPQHARFMRKVLALLQSQLDNLSYQSPD